MGELSFNFRPTTEPQYLAQFKYWFENSIEYSFAYRRYISLSDTSIFNSPVAITKVATGLSDLYELFVDKLAHSTFYKELTESVYKVSYDMNTTSDGQIIHKQSHSFILKDTTDFTEKTNNSNMSIYENLSVKPHDNLLNQYQNLMIKPHTNILTRYLKNKWGLIENHLFIDDDESLKKIYGSSLDIYKDLYNASITDLLNIYHTNNILTPFRNGLNIYDDILLKRPTNRLNIIENIFGKPYRASLNIYDDLYLEIPTNNLEIYEQILVKQRFRKGMGMLPVIQAAIPTNRLNIIENVFAQPKYHKSLNVFKTLLSYKTDKEIFMINDCYLSSGYSIVNANTELSGKKENPYANIIDIIFGITDGKSAILSNSDFAKTSGKTASLITKDLFGSQQEKEILKNKTYGVYHLDKSLVYFDMDSFAVSEQKYCVSLSDVFVSNTNKFMDVPDYESIFKAKDQLFIDTYTSVTKDDKKLYCDSQVYAFKSNKKLNASAGINLVVNNKNAGVYKNTWVLKDNKYLSYFDDYMFGELAPKDITYKDCIFGKLSSKDISYDDYVFTDKNNKDIYLSNQYYAYKFSKNTEIHNTAAFISKNRLSFILLSDTFVDKDRKSIIAENWITSVYKSRLSIENKNWIEQVFKDRKSIELKQSGLNIAKDRLSITQYNEDIWSLKLSHDINILYQDFMNKAGHDLEIFQSGQSIIKDRISIENFDIDALFKYYIPTDLIDTIIGSGLIIPVSKIEHQGYIDTINNSVYKIPYEGYIDSEDFASVISRPVSIPDIDLVCDKEQHKVYIEYKNIQITKERIHASLFKDEFVSKQYHKASLDSSIFVQKEQHEGFVTDIEKVLKTPNKAFIDDTVFVDKNIKLGRIDKQIFADKNIKEVYINSNLFLEKIPHLCYYDYGIWTDKEALKTQIELQAQIHHKNKDAMITDMVSGISKKIKAWYDYDVFTNRIIQNSSLYKEISEVHKMYKDTGIRPEDFGNWVWVYETPDPFDPGYGIDELLLPENDTQYEQFEDIIFNKKTMKPRNPVKVIDETTFIAKYPTRHPIQKYSDVAVNYDDSAIKVEQYYGIEVDIMHTVFLKYYRIWQSKIFEFSTMTMVQAVKTMLDYLYTWIMEYFPTDKIEQALRVFKLIRWYGESAIIKNSQYIISYEYDTLESKLTTGKCLIPSDMDPDVNNYVANQTMIVDKNLGVIKANPMFVGISEAHVEFYIKHKKNTSFTFSLSNTVGSVNIYINGSLVDTISTSKLNITYQLPYQGDDMTTVRIEKDVNNNKSPIFYIGHIIIPNASFKDLSIEFDPVLRAGNKPLDEIAKKMISCANLYENRDEMYAIMRKNNLGLNETYRMMSEYWKLHHQDKTKGKRLTIKQV